MKYVETTHYELDGKLYEPDADGAPDVEDDDQPEAQAMSGRSLMHDRALLVLNDRCGQEVESRGRSSWATTGAWA